MKSVRRLPATLLVDLPNWVGDQMMAMPALNRLVEGNHSGETLLHTRPNMVRLLEMVFPETRIVASPRKASPFSSARAVRGLEGRFGVGVTLRNACRAKILIRLGARWSVGSRGEGALILLSERRLIPANRHQVHDADPLLAALGLDPADPSWHPPLPAVMKSEGKAALRNVGVDPERAIGLAPATARGEAKRWPVERFGMIASRLSARGCEPVVVIGPGETSIAEALQITAGRQLPVIGEGLDVAGIAAVIGVIPVVVGNDSGAVQVAARIGTPTVAIFGPTDPRRTGILGGHHRVISRSLECSPCTASRCPLGHHECMLGVSVDTVEAAILDVIEGLSG